MPEKRTTNNGPTPRQRRSVDWRPEHAKHASDAATAQPTRRSAGVASMATSVVQSRKPKVNILPIVIGVAVLIILAVAYSVFSSYNASASIEDGTEVRIEIAEGSTAPAIADKLYEAGLIGNADHFVNAARARGVAEQLKSGSYVFVGGMSEDELIDKLIAGVTTQDGAVTVPEGSTIQDVAKAVETTYEGSITADEFLEVATNASAYEADYPFVAGAYNNSLEGFLFPKTYPYLSNATADMVVRQMLDQYQTEVANLDYSYPQSKGLSEYETLILASIVERETGGDVEPQGKVASVFYNRLAIDMALQSDATTAYEVGHDPTPEDLKVNGAFNTYLNKGLPPGPINSPSLETLQAVCSPETTDYLYFYFKKDSNGVMQYYFSKTYEEHQQAIAEH